jgi:hypothetical protein
MDLSVNSTASNGVGLAGLVITKALIEKLVEMKILTPADASAIKDAGIATCGNAEGGAAHDAVALIKRL